MGISVRVDGVGFFLTVVEPGLKTGFLRMLVSSMRFRRMDFFLRFRKAHSGQTGSIVTFGESTHEGGSSLSHWMQRFLAMPFP